MDPVRPATLLGAAVIVALEGLGMVALAVLEVLAGSAGHRGVAVTSGIFFALVGVGLLVFARGLARAESWARGPVVAAELIVLLVAYGFRSGTLLVAVLLALVALLALGCVFAPATTRALAQDEPG